MKFPFVLRSTLEEQQKDTDCIKWSLNKQLDQMEHERQGLVMRIIAGEKYREGLERRINDLLEDNRILYEGRAEARRQLAEAERQIKALSLITNSLDARRQQREDNQKKTEAAKE